MPRQDSVTEQLIDLIQLANKHGMYDAADWIRVQLGETNNRRRKIRT